MKLLVLISFGCLAHISGLDYPAVFILENIDTLKYNQFFYLVIPYSPSIRELRVKKVITEEDQISIDYKAHTKAGTTLNSGENASFCGDDVGTEGGSIAEAVRKVFAIEESNCPIAEQYHTPVPGVVKVDMQNTDIDTNCKKFFVHAIIRVHRSSTPLAELDFGVIPQNCTSREV